MALCALLTVVLGAMRCTWRAPLFKTYIDLVFQMKYSGELLRTVRNSSYISNCHFGKQGTSYTKGTSLHLAIIVSKSNKGGSILIKYGSA